MVKSAKNHLPQTTPGGGVRLQYLSGAGENFMANLRIFHRADLMPLTAWGLAEFIE